MWPLVCTSRPAIMRRVVVFPQPEGPRMTRNSPSKISSETSSTATSPLKRLVTWSSRIPVIVSQASRPSPPRHGPEGESGDDVPLEEDVDDEDGQAHEQSERGHDPVDARADRVRLGIIGKQPERERAHIGGGEEDVREREVGVGADE